MPTAGPSWWDWAPDRPLRAWLPRPLPPQEPRIDLEQRLQAAVGDQYRILKELGGGGMSRVFLAEEVRLGRQVVIKLLPPEMGAAVNVERFEREIQLAARLQHPHIVPLLTAGASGDLLYYVMPFISGESLRVKLAREGELPVAEAVRILREVVDALAYAHRNGVVHRDIKPDNILLSEGHAVVTDFGVAKAVSASSGGALAHLARRGARHAGLHGARAGRGRPARGPPGRYLRRRRAGLRDAGRAAAVHRADGPGAARGADHPNAGAGGAVPPQRCRRRSTPSSCAASRSAPADRWQSAAELVPQLDAMSTPSSADDAGHGAGVISTGTEKAIRRGHPVRVAAPLLSWPRWWCSPSSGRWSRASGSPTGCCRRRRAAR